MAAAELVSGAGKDLPDRRDYCLGHPQQPYDYKSAVLSDGGAELSTDASCDREGDLEDTLHSNASKEFSFGTTTPAQLPPAEDLNAFSIAGAKAPQDTPLAPVDEESASQQTSRSDRAGERAAAPARKKTPPSELQFSESTVQETEVLSKKSPQSDSDQRLSPTSESEAGELFTFGTTCPLKLPDPMQLRQAGTANSSPEGRVHPTIEKNAFPPQQCPVETAGDEYAEPFFSPTFNQAPLPPVHEAPPMPPAVPPDEGVAMRSQWTPQRSRSFNGEVACYASPPPLTPLMQVSPPMQYGPLPLHQPYLQHQVSFGHDHMLPVEVYQNHAKVAYGAEVLPHDIYPDYAKVAVPNYNYDCEEATVPSYNYDCEGALEVDQDDALGETWGKRSSMSSMYPLSGYEDPDYAPEMALEKISSAATDRHRRIGAACCIVILVVLAGGIVVFLVK